MSLLSKKDILEVGRILFFYWSNTIYFLFFLSLLQKLQKVTTKLYEWEGGKRL